MAATYSKPLTIPRWADTSLNILEPPNGKKDEGWLFEEIPPSSWENWRTNLIGQWFKWLDERLADGVDENELVIKDPSDGSDAITTGSNLITFGWPLNHASLLELGANGVQTLELSDSYAKAKAPLRFNDDLFYADLTASKPTIVFDSGLDLLEYDRAGNRWSFKQAATEVFAVGPNGAEFGDQNFYLQFSGGNPFVFFDANDYLRYDRASDWLQLFTGVGAVEVFRAYTSGGVPNLRIGPASTTNARTTFGSDLDNFVGLDGLTMAMQSDGTGSVSGYAKRAELTSAGFFLRDGPNLGLVLSVLFNDFIAGSRPDWVFNGGPDVRFKPNNNASPVAQGSLTAGLVRGAYDSDDPAGPNNLNLVCARNATLAVASLNMNGAANPTLLANHWNVLSVVRTGTGLYTLTLHEPITTTAVIHVSVSYINAASQSGAHNAHGYPLSATTVQIRTYSSNSLADLDPGDIINISIHGRPSSVLAP